MATRTSPMRASPSLSMPRVGRVQACATISSPSDTIIEWGAAYASLRPKTERSPFVATIAMRPGRLLRRASRLGRSLRSTLSLDSSARTDASGWLASTVATRTDCRRFPVVCITPLVKSMPGERAWLTLGVYGWVMSALAAGASMALAAKMLATPMVTRAVDVLVVRCRSTYPASDQTAGPPMERKSPGP